MDNCYFILFLVELDFVLVVVGVFYFFYLNFVFVFFKEIVVCKILCFFFLNCWSDVRNCFVVYFYIVL